MSYYAKRKQSDFIPAPEGLHAAVCCDVVDLGIVKTSWQGQESLKDMVRLVWQTEDTIPSGQKIGQPYIISKRYSSSTHKKAALRIHCESWRGKGFTDEEFAEFDIERLIGVCCQIQISHNVSGGDTYANIMAIVPYPKGKPPLKVLGYTRVKNRPGYKPPTVSEDAPSGGDDASFPGDVEETSAPEGDIPF